MNRVDGKSCVGIVEPRNLLIDLPEDGFVLDSGERLPELNVVYETYGELTEARDNVIFICHALTGDAHVAGLHAGDANSYGWWDQMVGPGKGIDTDHYHVVCANILGGCRGTTGPSSINPDTGKPYGGTFPAFTVGDIVNVHRLLLQQLGIERLAALVGGSFGGMQVLEWILRYPEMIERAVCIASASSLSTQALSFDTIGRKAITSDPNWQDGNYYGSGRSPDAGLDVARRIGHVTYLSAKMMDAKFGRVRAPQFTGPEPRPSRFDSDFEVERYLDHQGEKFVRRFDANSYLYITRAMDEFDLEDRCGSLDQLFDRIRSKMLIVALSSDWLFLPEQSQAIANALLRSGKNVSYCLLRAPHGHDAFLVDVEHLTEVIRAFLPWVEKTGDTRSSPDEPGDVAGSESGSSISTPAEPGTRSSCRGSCQVSTRENEYQRIIEMIRPGSSVLDLGCGDGSLLSVLTEHCRTVGIGVDIDIDNVIKVIDRGHDIFQADIDAGLAMIPDHSYDYAVLSETLQVVRKPRYVLREMLRVAGEGIVAFPNFGKWSCRMHLLLAGRMPKGGALPFEWYDTPNIHVFTIQDFVDLCREDEIQILDMVCIPAGIVDRCLLSLGLCNAGAERILVRIAR